MLEQFTGVISQEFIDLILAFCIYEQVFKFQTYGYEAIFLENTLCTRVLMVYKIRSRKYGIIKDLEMYQ